MKIVTASITDKAMVIPICAFSFFSFLGFSSSHCSSSKKEAEKVSVDMPNIMDSIKLMIPLIKMKFLSVSFLQMP